MTGHTAAASAAHVIADQGFRQLKEHVIAVTGLAYYERRSDELAHRLGRRMAARDIDGCVRYLDVLRAEEGRGSELDALVAELTIGETYFFRNEEHFRALRDVILPDLVARKQASRRLRVWSAGCATGPEPYSLAILFQVELAALLAGWEITILGTDVNRSFLARAEDGVYSDWALRETPAGVRDACFTPLDGSWRLRPELRSGVSFLYHNLVSHPYPSLLHNLAAFDLILCRNVLIYFDRTTTRGVIGHLHDCLVEGGWLVVGHAEHEPSMFSGFRPVSHAGTTVYQRNEETGMAPASWEPASVLDAAHAAPQIAPPIRSVRSPEQAPTRTPVPRREVPAPELARMRELADSGQWDAALALLQTLLEHHRLDPRVHFHHALILDQAGAVEESEQALRRTLYLDRDHVLAHYHLGLQQHRCGDDRGARRSLANAIDLLLPRDQNDLVEDADGLTVGNLVELARIHQELLGAR